MVKFLFSIFLILYCLIPNHFYDIIPNKNVYCISNNINTVYINDIQVINNSKLEFYLPHGIKIKTLIPISFSSPSGKQLTKFIQDFIEPLENRINIPLSSPLTEKGTYTISFTSMDLNTNRPVNINGSFKI